jgi:uncharacterized protein (DUF1810 family)
MLGLERFVEAQNPVIDQVRRELAEGRKETHWMWFVFPQLAGLGTSAMARHYAIQSLNEARQYLAHPTLGPRLVECVELALRVRDRTAWQIFGSPDDVKFRSCVTLFARAADGHPEWRAVFQAALDKYFDGEPDLRTLALLR